MRRGPGVILLAALIGAMIGLVVAGLPDFDEPPTRAIAADVPSSATTLAPATTAAATTSTTTADTTPESSTTSTTRPRSTTTTTDPDRPLAGVRVEVVNSGSRGGTASAVATRLEDEFDASATAADGPSIATSYVASTAGFERAAEVIAFLLGIDDIRVGELNGVDRVVVALARDYRE